MDVLLSHRKLGPLVAVYYYAPVRECLPFLGAVHDLSGLPWLPCNRVASRGGLKALFGAA